MGGDDLHALAMLFGYKEHFDILGITTCFGNVTCEQATRNALDLISYIGEEDSIYEGSKSPYEGKRIFDDEAFGENGVGGVVLPSSPISAKEQSAISWVVKTVNKSETPITIFCTGPMTNIAHALDQGLDPKKIDRLIIMGGCEKLPVPAIDNHARKGNITLNSEFNIFQDAEAAQRIFDSGLNIHLIKLDTTHGLWLDPDKRKEIENNFKKKNTLLSKLIHELIRH